MVFFWLMRLDSLFGGPFTVPTLHLFLDVFFFSIRKGIAIICDGW
jgi:hypothetical protein